MIRSIFYPSRTLGEYGSDLHFPRGRAPVGRDASWSPGFVLAVIRAPMLLINSAARLIEIRDSSNFRALDPAWDRGCRFQLARPPEYSTERS